MIHSLWSATQELPHFDTLKGRVATDVLIIGGGMAGILCAYQLRQRGVDCVLLEGGTIGCGVTKNTTAKITAQHGLIYAKLLKSAGEAFARQYLEANLRAAEEFRRLCMEIDCDYEEKSAFVYSLDDEQKIQDEIRALKKLGFSAEFCKQLPLPFSVAGAVEFPKQAQFHPLKFLAQIVKGLPIYENSFVTSLDGNTASTNQGRVTAKKIIVATHFPFVNLHGSYFLKMYQHRSYVIALENAPDVKGMYVDEAENGMSFRNQKNLLLVGGGDHRTGKQGGNWKELRQFAKQYYPDAKERYAWAAQDCMTLDTVPYIGHYSRNTHDLYVATGFNKWGMTTSMVSADILSDMVSGKRNGYAEVFSPHRSILKPQLLVNGFEAVVNLLTISKPRCPHLGCALKWNETEHSWDCPCHGSRFEKDGRLIDNPATGSLKK